MKSTASGTAHIISVSAIEKGISEDKWASAARKSAEIFLLKKSAKGSETTAATLISTLTSARIIITSAKGGIFFLQNCLMLIFYPFKKVCHIGREGGVQVDFLFRKRVGKREILCVECLPLHKKSAAVKVVAYNRVSDV